MPEWVIALLVAIIAATPGMAGWHKARLENARQKERQTTEREQILQTVAETASATALRCLETAAKELHLELDDTRAQMATLRERLAETERELAEMKGQLQAERTRSAQAEAQMEDRIRELEAERAALLLRIGELEGRK